MKELTIEEKAARYDESIKKAKECHTDGLSLHQPVKDILEHIFPELAESEDERIRKALISQYQGDGCLCTNKYRIDFKDIRAWLEKQGEHTSVTDLRTWKYIADYVVTKWCGIGQYLDNPRLTTIAEELQKKYSLKQKQGEQKPAEWSEEDRIHYNKCLQYLESISPRKEDIEWFKSLRPQSSWKPSKEQMDALENAIRYGEEESIGILSLLYNDLKKLTE